jgi:hypothetical protein
MPELEASRTLVKSTPELWAECSDAASLARHLGAFGEIRITRLEPETAVAWEGDEVRGTVTLEPSGWGTRVVLTAVREGEAEGFTPPEPAPESLEAEASPEGSPWAEESPWSEPAPGEEALELAPPPITPSVVSGMSQSPAAAAPLPEPTLLMRVLSRLGVRVRWPAPEAVTGPLEVDPDPEPFSEPAPDPAAVEEPVAEETQPEADEEPEASEPELDALISALDSLGTPRRRPFSRA